MRPISIGPLRFDSPLFMAPMEGITDVPFRRIVRKNGCGVTCTQMIHAEGLLRGEQSRMRDVTTMEPGEQPVGMQLCGSDAQNLSEATRKAQDMGAAFVDLNMGCPAKNVVARGAGAALMKDVRHSAQIIRAMVQAVSIPITVKIRAGWDAHTMTGLDIAQAAQAEGAALISVHARTRSQAHKGEADWTLFDAIKDKVSVPVVGNGGVNSPEDIQKLMATTRVDGVMLARGALGNPWLFSLRVPTVAEIYDTLCEHFDAHLKFYTRLEQGIITFRKHIVWYTKGLPNAAPFRIAIFKHKELATVQAMLRDYFTSLPPHSTPSREDGRLEEAS